MFFRNLYGFGRRNPRGREIRRDDRVFRANSRVRARGGKLALPPAFLPAAAGGLLLLAVAGIAYGAHTAGRRLCSENPDFLLREIVLPSGLAISRELVLERIQIAPGDNLFARSAAEIRQSLLGIPAIKGALVTRVLPDRLEIDLRMRQPVARVGNENGFSFIVDSEGMVFTKSNRLRALPLILGVDPVALKFGQSIVTEHSRDALTTLRILEARKLQEVLPVRLISIGHPEYLDLRLAGGQQLKLPRNRLEDGLERLATAFQKSLELGLGKKVFFMTDGGQVVGQ